LGDLPTGNLIKSQRQVNPCIFIALQRQKTYVVISMLTDKPTGLFVHHGGKVTYFCRRKQIIPSFSLDYSSHTLTEGSWLASLSSSKNPSLDSCLSSDMIL
jgi:hypothetical protein